jgi:DNA-binding NarL/FixJ family response regulator
MVIFAMSSPRTRIFLVDDHEVVRRGVRVLLETEPDFEICGECSDGRQAVERVVNLKPDVVIMDLGLPTLNGCEATRQVISGGSGKGVVILTMDDSEEMLRNALGAGASGYVLKTDGGSEIIDAVRAVVSGRTFFSTSLAASAKRVVEEGRGKKSGTRSKHGGLTRREREVLQLLAEGRMNKQVAEVLGISIKTAETHRARIMRKLNVETAAGMVRYAIRNKIVRP